MKRTTLWAQCAALLLCAATHANAQTYAQFSATPTSEVKDNGTGLIGIGNISPVSAKLHVYHSGSEPVIQASLSGNTTVRPSHYFLAEKRTLTGVPPNFVLTQTTDFVVDSIGRVGIGVANPNTLLTVKVRNWPASNREELIDVRDANDNPLIKIANEGTSADPGASLGVYAKSDRIGFAVVSAVEAVKFCVHGNGRVGIGTHNPAATLDIQRDAGGSLEIINAGAGMFKMLNNGNVQIFPASTATGPALNVKNMIDITGSKTTKLRFTAGTSDPHHEITGTLSGDMTIDPGSGKGNDKLIIDGEVVMRRGGTEDLHVDLVENTANGWNAQLRIVGTGGEARHIITEVDNELYLDPGFNGNATDNVKIAGNLKTSGRVQVGNSAPTGSYSGYMLSIDGDMVAKKVIVQTGSWADKVFAQGYNLRSLGEVEKYIAQNGHLPEIPSECEVLDNGVDVGEMNKLLLQKVEELTLHVIALQKQIDALNQK